MSILIVSILGNHECWWARFVPQMWSIPAFIIMYGLISDINISNRKKIIMIIITLVAILNSLLINIQYLSDRIKLTISFNNYCKTLPPVINIIESNKMLETLPVKLQERGFIIKNSDTNSH